MGVQTAGFQAALRAHFALGLAILATTTLIILFAMTRSVVLPIKALVMNPLSLCAAFGLLVRASRLAVRVRVAGRDRVLPARAAVRGRLRLSTGYGVFLVIAIGCFVTAHIFFVKFAVAVAVPIVRAWLVPALVRLPGDWNRWAPRVPAA